MRVTIVVTTWLQRSEVGIDRLLAARTAIASWERYLLYKGDLFLHVADDGSDRDLLRLVRPTKMFRGNRITSTQQQRCGVGASLNAGFAEGFRHSPIVAYFVDDWALTAPLDITPWVELLDREQDVGMLRLGPPIAPMSGALRVFPEGHHALEVGKEGFGFCHRPALYHKRMIETYGWFSEDVDAVKCEADYVAKFNGVQGPGIIYALPHPWEHLPSFKLSNLMPGEGDKRVEIRKGGALPLIKQEVLV